MIGVAVLAAGASVRMGRPKQLLRLGGRSLLRRAAEEAVGSGCAPVVVVLGAEAERLGPELHGLPVGVVLNARWAEGMSTSVRAGLEALQGHGVEAAILMLCDQPFVAAPLLRRLAATYREGRRLVACEYGGTLGVPALFDPTLFPELLALQGDRGARQVIAAHAAEAGRIPFPEGAVDLDTVEDYARHVGALETGGGQTIEELRAAIDELDARLVEWLCQRGRIVQRIQSLKGNRDRVPEREADILANLARSNRGPYPTETLRRIWEALFEAASGL
jgi:molybdenum cofactor cytidylyltransferase